MENKILVVGCGGIGCEVIKLLLLSDKSNITLLDCDTIEISNLNRQFLFIEKHIGKDKSETCKNILNSAQPSWNIKSITGNICDFGLEFFNQFDVVFNCLDNNESRSYVNLNCYLSGIILIDGGSSGFLGQSYIFKPGTECFECVPKPSAKVYNICTIRTIPTLFEHCLEYCKSIVLQDIVVPNDSNYLKYYRKYLRKQLESDRKPSDILFKRETKKIVKYLGKLLKKNPESISYKTKRLDEKYMLKNADFSYNNNKIRKKNLVSVLRRFKHSRERINIIFDKNNKYILKLVYEMACIRAKSFNIEILPYKEAQSILCNIIPSIVTTNSIVSSLMFLSYINHCNYFITLGNKLVSKLDISEKNKMCAICSHTWIIFQYREKISAEDIFSEINKCFTSAISCKYMIDDKNIIYSKFPQNNLKTLLNIKKNSFSTIFCNNNEVLKIFFSKLSDKNKILEVKLI